MILPIIDITRFLTISFAASCFFLSPPPSCAETGLLVTTNTNDGPSLASLKPCRSDRNCVSSNYLEPPNRYVSPLRLVNDRDKAFQRAVRDLNSAASLAATIASKNTASTKLGQISLVEVRPEQYYVHLTVPGTAPGSLDDIELLFAGQDVVNLRCDARVTLPIPPFCLKRNCINGNMDQRSRLDQVALILNLPPSDQQQMKQQAKWTPIFFNSDRVPGFDGEGDDWD